MGLTALHLGAFGGHRGVVRLLLANGANVHAKEEVRFGLHADISRKTAVWASNPRSLGNPTMKQRDLQPASLLCS